MQSLLSTFASTVLDAAATLVADENDDEDDNHDDDDEDDEDDHDLEKDNDTIR